LHIHDAAKTLLIFVHICYELIASGNWLFLTHGVLMLLLILLLSFAGSS